MSTHWTSATSTTWDSNLDTMLFSAEVDTDGYWLFSDRQTNVWGRGRTLIEAMCDYWAALFSHIAVLEDKPLAPNLERELRIMRRAVSLFTGAEHSPSAERTQ